MKVSECSQVTFDICDKGTENKEEIFMRVFKKGICVLLVLMMIAALIAITPLTASADSATNSVYLVAGSNWIKDGARFAIFVKKGDSEAWASMAKVENDLYCADIPAGEWDTVTFCRMNGNAADNNWNNKWNTTAALAIPADKNCYTKTNDTWDGDDAGTWSLRTPDTFTGTLYLKPNANWKNANARFALYLFSESQNNTWVSMTQSAADSDYYEAAVPAGTWHHAIFCRMNPNTTENNWNNKWTQTNDLSPDQGNNCYLIADDATEYQNANGSWKYFDPNTLTLAGYAIGLQDEIAMYFYYKYDNTGRTLGDVNVSGTIANAACAVKAEDIAPAKATGYANKKYTVMVPARSMNDNVTLSFTSGQQALVTNTKTIAAYAVTLAGMYPDNAVLKALLCDMLNYGDSVQKYFGYNGDNGYAGTAIASIDANWTAAAFGDELETNTSLASEKEKADIFGLEYAGATLSATAKTIIRLFFKQTDETKAASTTISIARTAAEIKTSNTGLKYVEITGINAKDIFEDILITFDNGDDSDGYVYNAKSYYNAIMAGNFYGNDGGEQEAKLQAVLKAMYGYSTSAVAYFNA